MMGRARTWAALLMAWIASPWLVGSLEYGCPELRTELVSILVGARDEIDPELPIPELVSAEQVDLPETRDGGCGGRDDCSGVSYARFVFGNLTRPVVIFKGVGGDSRRTPCDIRTGVAGVELESGDYELRFEVDLIGLGPICVQNLGPDGRRSRPLQVYMPEWLAENGGG